MDHVINAKIIPNYSNQTVLRSNEQTHNIPFDENTGKLTPCLIIVVTQCSISYYKVFHTEIFTLFLVKHTFHEHHICCEHLMPHLSLCFDEIDKSHIEPKTIIYIS